MMITTNLLILLLCFIPPLSIAESSLLRGSQEQQDGRELQNTGSGCAFKDMIAQMHFQTTVEVNTWSACSTQAHIAMGEMIVDQFVKSDVEMPMLVSQDETIADGANETDSGTNTSICVRPDMKIPLNGTTDRRQLGSFSFRWRWRGSTSCGFGCSGSNGDRRKLEYADTSRILATGSLAEFQNFQDAEVDVKKAELDLAKAEKDHVNDLKDVDKKQQLVYKAREEAKMREYWLKQWIQHEYDCPLQTTECDDKEDALIAAQQANFTAIDDKYDALIAAYNEKIVTAQAEYEAKKAILDAEIDEIELSNKYTLEGMKEKKTAEEKLLKTLTKYKELVENKLNKKLEDADYDGCFENEWDRYAEVVFTRVDTREEAEANATSFPLRQVGTVSWTTPPYFPGVTDKSSLVSRLMAVEERPGGRAYLGANANRLFQQCLNQYALKKVTVPYDSQDQLFTYEYSDQVLDTMQFLRSEYGVASDTFHGSQVAFRVSEALNMIFGMDQRRILLKAASYEALCGLGLSIQPIDFVVALK